MNINYNKIKELYGIDYLYLIKDNIEDIKLNIDYLYKLGFNDVEDIFERYTFLFIKDNDEFRLMFNKLITNLGSDYVDIIENDLGVLEELEW